MADDQALFLFRCEAANHRSLQSIAEARLHECDCSWRAIDHHWFCCVEAGATFLAGVAHGWLSLRPHLAFRGDVGDPGVCFWAPGHGGSARLEQLRFHADGMEEKPNARIAH